MIWLSSGNRPQVHVYSHCVWTQVRFHRTLVNTDYTLDMCPLSRSWYQYKGMCGYNVWYIHCWTRNSLVSGCYHEPWEMRVHVQVQECTIMYTYPNHYLVSGKALELVIPASLLWTPKTLMLKPLLCELCTFTPYLYSCWVVLTMGMFCFAGVHIVLDPASLFILIVCITLIWWCCPYLGLFPGRSHL